MSMEIQTLLLIIYLFDCLEDHVISCEDNNKPFLKKGKVHLEYRSM